MNCVGKRNYSERETTRQEESFVTIFLLKNIFLLFLVEKRIEAHTKTTNISAETFSENLFLAQIFQIIINRV